MTDQHESVIRKYFSEPVRLPTNFAWLVAQKVNARRVELAKTRARLLSSLIGFFMCVVSVAILGAYTAYYEVPQLAIPFVEAQVLPAIAVFVLIFLVDAVINLRAKS